MDQNKCLGIIGGHGYNATIELQYYINEEINKYFDTRNYIKTFVINDATINSETETIDNLYENTDNNSKIEESIYDSYCSLIKMGCNIITIPCNTYSDLLSKNKYIQQSNIKLINIVEVTCNWINYNLPRIPKIGLIATQQTIDSKLYQNRLFNYEIITFPELKLDINSIILSTQYGYYKTSPPQKILSKLNIKTTSLIDTMNKIINKFRDNGINHLILGCTELPIFVKYNIKYLNNIIFIDTLEILSKNIIES